MSEDDNSDVIKSVVKAGAEAVTEVAKAEQETQKTYQGAIDLVRRIGAYLGGVFGPASHELSMLFGDQMRYWRFKNAANILEKAQAIVERRGLKPEQVKALGFGEGLLLLEASSLEEDDTVQEMWARLMANAVDPSSGTRAEKVYIDLLKSISGREATLLDLIERIETKGKTFRSNAEIEAFDKEMGDLAESAWRRFAADERAISVQNLVRLRCLAVRAKPIDVQNLFAHIPHEQGGRSLTAIGGGRWAVIDPQKFQDVLKEIVERQMAASGMADFKHYDGFALPYNGTSFRRGAHKLNLPEANFMLTPLGKGLMVACRLDSRTGCGAPSSNSAGDKRT